MMSRVESQCVQSQCTVLCSFAVCKEKRREEKRSANITYLGACTIIKINMIQYTSPAYLYPLWWAGRDVISEAEVGLEKATKAGPLRIYEISCCIASMTEVQCSGTLQSTSQYCMYQYIQSFPIFFDDSGIHCMFCDCLYDISDGSRYSYYFAG